MSSHFSKCLAHWFRIIGSFLIHFSDTHLILNKSWHLGPWWCGQVVSLHAFHSNNPSSIHAEAYSFFPTNLCLKRSNKTRKWPILKKTHKSCHSLFGFITTTSCKPPRFDIFLLIFWLDETMIKVSCLNIRGLNSLVKQEKIKTKSRAFLLGLLEGWNESGLVLKGLDKILSSQLISSRLSGRRA